MKREREGARIALVTGATRRAGIGAAICRALAADGADTAFTHWNAYDATMDWGGDPDGPAALKAELEVWAFVSQPLNWTSPTRRHRPTYGRRRTHAWPGDDPREQCGVLDS
ncbi:MAG: hypothetical protein WKH64_19280 [Chloroflexia bacterium]